MRPGVWTIDLVDDHDRRKPPFEGFAEHEPGLWHGPLRRVDEQHDTVHHRQCALDLSTEVRVARRVDNVDQQVLVVNRRVLGENSDAALAFQLVAVQDAFGDALVGPERAALMQ